MKSHVPVPVPNKVWNATFISVLIANMATNLGQFMMNTLIPKYANAMGASATMVGFVSSSFAVTALLLKVFAAPMIDTFNKKYLTFGSVLVIMTAFLGYSVSTSVTMMICFRLLHGAGMAFSTISFLGHRRLRLAAGQDWHRHRLLLPGTGRHTGYCADSGFGTGVGHRV